MQYVLMQGNKEKEAKEAEVEDEHLVHVTENPLLLPCRLSLASKAPLLVQPGCV